MEATGEHDGGDEIERYENLRSRALGGEPSGWRLGLAVVLHRGVAAWLRATHAISPSPPPSRVIDVGVGGDELVGLLTSMALVCLVSE